MSFNWNTLAVSVKSSCEEDVFFYAGMNAQLNEDQRREKCKDFLEESPR